MARTGSGGTHYYFQYVPGINNSAGKIGVDIDIRGQGGYGIVPPSKNGAGSYEWLERNSYRCRP